MGPGESWKNCIDIQEFETKFEKKVDIKAGSDEGVMKIKNFFYNVFQLPEGIPPPPGKLANPLPRWGFETMLLGMS